MRTSTPGYIRPCDSSQFTRSLQKRGLSSSSPPPESFWTRFLAPKEMPARWTTAWYQEMALICTVFAITGSSTMMLVSGFCLY